MRIRKAQKMPIPGDQEYCSSPDHRGRLDFQEFTQTIISNYLRKLIENPFPGKMQLKISNLHLHFSNMDKKPAKILYLKCPAKP